MPRVNDLPTIGVSTGYPASFETADEVVALTNSGGIVVKGAMSILPFAQSGTGAGTRTVQAKAREVVSVTDFYANGVSGALVDNTGVTESSLGYQAAFDSLSSVGEVFGPKGTYKVNSGFTMDTRQSFRGEGQGATILSFTPTSDNTACITVSNGAAVAEQNNLSSFTISGGGTKIKIGIRLNDTSMCGIDDVAITLFAVGTSPGPGNIGIQLRGREFTTISRCLIGYCDKPYSIEPNINGGIIDCDHLHIRDSYTLSTAGNYHITIADDVALTNLVIDGTNAMVAGDGCIYWVDTTSASAAVNMTVKNIRAESQTDSTKYLFRLDRTAFIQNLRFENIYGGLVAKGWYLRNVEDVAFVNTKYINGSNDEALNVNNTVWRMSMFDAKFAGGTTATLTGQRLVFGAVPISGPLTDFGFYETTNGAVANFGRFNAAGVSFPATQVASSDANTLDDYEEGTWTPAVGGDATYTAQVGTYVKIGRLVFVQMDLTINVIGTGSTTTVSGLPFTAAAYSALAVGFYFTLATNVVELNATAESGSTTLVFRTLAAAGASTGTAGVLGNGTRVSVSGSYQI